MYKFSIMAPPEDVKPVAVARETVPLNTLLKLIPEFDTAQTTQVYRFVRSCDSAFSLSNDNQKDILLIYALNKITGSGSSDVHARQHSNWDDLKHFVIQKFSQTKTLAHLNLELQSLFQKQNESVTEYFHRVDLCRNKILEKLTAEVTDITLPGRKSTTEETALNVFINGLNSDLGTMLRTKEFTSLTTAANFAIQEEKIRNMNQARQTLYRHNRTSTTFHNNISRKSTLIPNNPTTSTLSMFKSTQTCNYCKKPGHVISECRKRSYNNNIKNRNQFLQNTPNSQRVPPVPTRVNNLNSQAAAEEGISTETASAPYFNALTQDQDLIPTVESLQLQ